MSYLLLLILAAAFSGTTSCPHSSPQLSILRDCHDCQLQRFDFSALNRYPTSQLGVVQLFRLITHQYLQFEFRKLSNSSGVLRVKCTAGGLMNRCASAIIVQEQDTGLGRVFLQTIRNSESGSLALDNDWLEVSITEPSNLTTLFTVCDSSKVYWKVGVVHRTSEHSAVIYRQLTETIPCWFYDEDLRNEWKTPCNISTARYRELANEMHNLVWYGRKEKRMKIVVVVILIVTALVALGYILLGKSFVRVAPTP